jgi:hypothetical protein
MPKSEKPGLERDRAFFIASCFRLNLNSMDITAINSDALREIEQSLGVIYPPFADRSLRQLAAIVDIARFQGGFLNATMLLGESLVAGARVNLPNALLPFMRIDEGARPDFLCI